MSALNLIKRKIVKACVLSRQSLFVFILKMFALSLKSGLLFKPLI